MCDESVRNMDVRAIGVGYEKWRQSHGAVDVDEAGWKNGLEEVSGCWDWMASARATCGKRMRDKIK